MKKLLILMYIFFLLIHLQGQNLQVANSLLQNAQSKVYFTENKGQIHDGNYQTRPDVLMMGISPSQQFVITDKGVSHQLKEVSYKTTKENPEVPLFKDKATKEIDSIALYRIDMEWVGNTQVPILEKTQENTGYTNYYNVPSASEGILNVKNYSEVRLKGIYKGIDVRYYGHDASIEYDYEVAPYTDYTQIQIKIRGAEAKLNEMGQLELATPLGTIIESSPHVFQADKVLKSKWIEIAKDTWGFEVENYNPALPLTIDPVIRVWGTYYGGSEIEHSWACTTDANGKVYVAGGTRSTSSIATTGAFQSTFGTGVTDAFLVQFDSSGTRQWATYYGGAEQDEARTCATDADNYVYLAGATASTAGIATVGAHQSVYGGWSLDGFLVKLDSNGIRQWATYYGGEDWDVIYSCVSNDRKSLYIVGNTWSDSAIATVNAHQTTHNGNTDAFLAKFDNNGVLQWATYYGGSEQDVAYSVAKNTIGDAYISGLTQSDSAIATSNAFQTNLDPNFPGDAFIAKFDSNGVRQWGTYYGGESHESFYSSAIDSYGNLYLGGYSDSDSAIATPNSYQPFSNGNWDAILVKFNPNGQRLWATYYGDTVYEYGFCCSIDANDNVYLGGCGEYSFGIIATPGSHQTNFGGGVDDAFLVKFNPNGIRQWGTFYGGNGQDEAYSIAIDIHGDIYLTGSTDSPNAIATPFAYQDTFAGSQSWYDAFLVKFHDCPAPASPISIFGADTVCSGITQTYSINAIPSAINYTWAYPGSNILITTDTFITFVPIISGLVSVSITDACGTSLPKTFNLTVQSIPSQPAAIFGEDSVCNGTLQNYFIASVAQAAQYNWTYTGGGIPLSTDTTTAFIPTSNGTLSVTATNACGTSIAQNIVIWLKSVNTNVTQNMDTLTANATNATYQWLNCNNNMPIIAATNQTFVPQVNGNYAVIVTENNCTDTSNCYLVTGLNIPKNNLSQQIKAYPNPTSGKLTVDLGNEYTKAEVKIMSLIGQIVSIEKYAHQPLLHIEIPDTQGVYFVHINLANGETATIKVIKE